jgi:hypothetical protein
MSYNLINTNIRGRKTDNPNTDFEVEEDPTNINSREEIMTGVAQFNKYYKNSENDFNVTNAYNSVAGRAAYVAEKHFEDANGRVSGVGKSAIPSFHVNQENQQEIYNNFASESIKGNFEQTDFSKYYFSEHNVEGIQRSIKKEVYDISNGEFRIDHQSENSIKTVMRSYFLQYKLKLNVDILSQIRGLNKKVIRWCVDEIYSNLLQYQQYKHDISNMPVTMSHPLNMSIKGSRTYDLSDRNNMSRH